MATNQLADPEDAKDHFDVVSTKTESDTSSHHQSEDTNQPSADEKSSLADECEICQTHKRRHSATATSPAMQYRDQIPSSFRANAAAARITGTTMPATSSSDKCEQNRLNGTIILAIIAGVTAIILASGIQTLSPNDAAIQSHVALLTNRIEKLESDNIAMRMEISRMVDLVYRRSGAGASRDAVDSSRPTDDAPAASQRNRKRSGKRVWLGDGPLDEPVTLNKRPKSPAMCNDDNSQSSDNLFGDYNAKKCERLRQSATTSGERATTVDASRTPDLLNAATFASKADSDFSFGRLVIDPSAQIPSQPVQNRSGEFANEKRQRKYAKDERKSRKDRTSDYHMTKGEYGKSATRDTNDRPFREFAANDRTNEYNNAERNKYEKQQRKRKYEAVAPGGNERIVDDSSAADWYAKMMKNREELRGKFPNGFNEQNWYLDRGNERERVRTKSGKPPKQRYVGA